MIVDEGVSKLSGIEIELRANNLIVLVLIYKISHSKLYLNPLHEDFENTKK